MARGDVELQLVVDELQRMRSQRLDLQEQLRHEAGESTITRARIFDEVCTFKQSCIAAPFGLTLWPRTACSSIVGTALSSAGLLVESKFDVVPSPA